MSALQFGVVYRDQPRLLQSSTVTDTVFVFVFFYLFLFDTLCRSSGMRPTFEQIVNELDDILRSNDEKLNDTVAALG